MKSLAKNTSYLTFAYIIQKVFTFGYFIIVARSYGPVGQGQYSAALAYTALFAVLIDIGLASVITRETARRPELAGKYLGQALLFRFIVGLIVYGIILGSAVAIGQSTLMIQLIAIAGIATFFDMLATATWAIYRGLHNLKYESISVIIITIIMVGLGGAAAIFHMPLHYLIGAIVLASITNFVYGFSLIIKKEKVKVSLKLEKPLLKKLLTLTIPFAVAAIASRVYTNIDITLLLKMSGEEFAGWYSAANKMILALQFIPAALSAAIFPAMSTYFVKDKSRIADIYSKATYFLLLFSLPAAAGLATLSLPIMSAVAGVDYIPSAPVLQMLSIALISAFLIFPLGALLAAVNKQKINGIILSVAAVVNLIGNLLIIPHYQALGAAAVSGFTYTLILIVSLIVTREYWVTKIRFLSIALLKILIATGIMAFALVYVRDQINVVLSVVVGVVVYTVVILAIKGVTIGEFKSILKSLTKKESDQYAK